jgi:NADH-quinone oxidoreductase subunit L
VPAALGGSNQIEHFLDPIFESANVKLLYVPHDVEPIEYVLMAASVGIAVAGILLARKWYLKTKDVPERLATQNAAAYHLLYNKYNVDELYDAVVVNPVQKMSESFMWKIFDVKVVDGLVNGVPRVFGILSDLARKLQTGIAQSYVFVFLIGVVAIVGWLITK